MVSPHLLNLLSFGALRSEGWQGVWIDAYRRKYQTSCNPLNEVILPSQQQELLNRIYRRAGSRNGCWDVFCWKENIYLFAESKRYKHDKVRDSQKNWLESALAVALLVTSFLIAE